MISDDPTSTQLSSDPSSDQAQISYDPTSTQLRSQLRSNCSAPSPPSPPSLPSPRTREGFFSGPTRGLSLVRGGTPREHPGHVKHIQMSLAEPPGHVKHVQMSRSAPPDGTCLHLLKPAEISRPPRDVPPLAQTSSDHLSLARIHADGSAASRKHVNY